MSRPLRIQYPNAWYHVMNRGRRKEAIFLDDTDFRSFIELLMESTSMWNVNISAFCLMPNHYHFLIQTPEGNLSRVMRHINGVYTQMFNRRHGYDGQLFKGRYKSILVDKENYLLTLVRYIHRNPLRAGIVQRIGDYCWSSHHAYLAESKGWKWVHTEPVFSLLLHNKDKKFSEYADFVDRKDSIEIIDFYSKKNIPSLLGAIEFTDWVKEHFSKRLFEIEIPETKRLAPDIDSIKQMICKAYNLDMTEIMGIHRGRVNEARNIAVFLARRLRRDTLREIGEAFNISNYSSVSSIIETMKEKIEKNIDLKNAIEKYEKDLT